LSDRLHNMRTVAAMPAEAGAHQAGDPSTSRPAGPPPGHAGHEAAARGPLLFFKAAAPCYAEIDHMVATRSPEQVGST
jgi:hypothetical protein